jgi:hypothetical protein
VGLAGRDLHRHAVTQELVDAQIGLVERNAGRVGGTSSFCKAAEMCASV